jgi:hypothetical protein
MARKQHKEELSDEPVTVADATDALVPEAVPRNPDGSVQTEGEVSIEQAQLIGALTPESASRNQALAKTYKKKATGEKNVQWGLKDPLELFPAIKESYPSHLSSITIYVTRIKPEPMEQFPPLNMSAVSSATELYKYVESCHGRRGHATYEVRFRAPAGWEYGRGSIYMPDKSEPVPSPVGMGMSSYPGNPGPYPGYPAFPPPPPPAPVPQAPQSPPVVHVHPQQAAPQDQSAALGAMGQVSEMQRQFFEQTQARDREMMNFMREMVMEAKKPAPPPGFIPLPDGWNGVIPPGYSRIPTGMVPDMRPQAFQAPAPAPVPVQAVAPAGQPASYAAPVQPAYAMPVAQVAPVAAVPPSLDMVMGMQRTVKDFRGLMEAAQQLQNIAQTLVPQGGPVAAEAAAEAAEAAAEAASPLSKTMVGEVEVAYDQTGALAWVPTLMGAAPKIIDGVKSVVDRVQKFQADQQAAQSRAVQERIALANAATAAANAMRSGQGQLPSGQPPIEVRQGPESVPAPAPVRQPAQPVPRPASFDRRRVPVAIPQT